VTRSDSAQPLDPLPQADTQPLSLWRLIGIWLALGIQSFGGGTATLFLIRRAVVEQQQWLSDEEFTHAWSLCFVVPGINLLCLTVLVGHRVAGIAGALTALVGLLLPSVSITIVMTALYGRFQHVAVVQAALEGIIPATVGLGLMLAGGMTRSLLAASRRESIASLVVSVLLLAGSMAATALWRLPVAVVLAGTGALGALAMWWRATRRVGQP
jgi:chromate transporter